MLSVRRLNRPRSRAADHAAGRAGGHQPRQRVLPGARHVRGRPAADETHRRAQSGAPPSWAAACCATCSTARASKSGTGTWPRSCSAWASRRCAACPNTSKTHPGQKVYPYVLRGLKIARASQVWATPDGVRLGLQLTKVMHLGRDVPLNFVFNQKNHESSGESDGIAKLAQLFGPIDGVHYRLRRWRRK